MNQLTPGNDALPSTTSLLPSASSLMNSLAPFLLLSTAVSVLLVIAYVFSVIRRYKVEKAILAMQKDIREMNERDRNRAVPLPSSAAPAKLDDHPLIATEPPTESLG